MSQQGERPAAGDDWWNRLYDESAPDTGPAAPAGDTLDDRFDSAVDTVGPEGARGTWWRPSRRGGGAPWEPPAAPSTPTGSAEDPRASRTEPGWPAPTAPTVSAAPPPPPAPPPAPGVESPLPSSSVPSPPPPVAPPPTAPGGSAPDASSVPPVPATSAAPPVPAPVTPPPAAAGAEPVGDPAGGPPAALPPKPAAPPAGAADAPSDRVTRNAGRRGAVPWPRRKEGTGGRGRGGYVGDRPPTYDAEPTALPAADPDELDGIVADTVLDGARYGAFTLRAASVRGDSARYRGEPRRDALLTARFGAGEGALVLVAVATGARAAEGAHLAAADACRWIGGAVGRSHARLAEDIRAGRRGDLKSGLHRLIDRSFGKLRARAAELGVTPEEYTASLRCLLLSADPGCRTRVFFGVGEGGLFRLRDGGWQDLEPSLPDTPAGEPVVSYGSPPAGARDGDRLTMDLGVTTPPSPHIDAPVPPPAEPFRFRASVARPGDTLLLCSNGLADPLRGEAALAEELAERWAGTEPPGLATYLADTQLRVKGYADDRTACAVWEA
ncbi:protein phosphatase 2C domain-containing protein [Streptomyces sp. WMMC940]|uniref:protein phosphatase 2C domain-containing protein n=1 Tax=Streptomyces sp. WMMC940 TaxID=3015153 RepID=UPI0022B6261D|nr:protein phosphatase 2C domain-containing protein [Streptomyces sp. WMMC940]MCZ7457289.1 protein phosphatase 2C domain-containing protein [Streptomyces sp. WMMC940]